jgi:ABC-2 type transport system permease protein
VAERRRSPLRRAARAYAQFWRINALTTLEYRENFLIWSLFTLVYHGSAIAALWIVFDNFPSMNGWTFKDMAFLYGLWMLAHAFHNALFSNVEDVPERIRDGEFDRVMIRPLDALFQIVTTPGQIFPDEAVMALAYFGFAVWYSGVRVDAAFVIFVPLVVAGGVLIDLAINLMISTVAFWVVRVDELRWIFLQLESEFTRYPISIYSRGVRLLVTFVLPFAFVNYFPAAYFLHRDNAAFGLPPAVGLLTPLIGLAFASAAYGFWRFGLNRYQSVGH